MIKFSNGHSFRFCCASGALGFDGSGWWFEKPWKVLGLLDPSKFTIITKTLTYFPRTGNLKMWCPWRCIRKTKNGFVNSVGLTNPGYRYWINNTYERTKKRKIIVSLAPQTRTEATEMANDFNKLDIVGIELNLNCPNNTNHDDRFLCDITEHFVKNSKHPVIAKIGYGQHVKICKQLEGKVEAFDLINSVPWKIMFPNEKSPLAKYNIGDGGVSGKDIIGISRHVLSEIRDITRTPIISGGGIYSQDEAITRFKMGADAISFGTLFLKRPWLPNQIIRDMQW